MLIYVYGKCSSCKKSLQFLTERGVNPVIKEITTTPPSLEELKQMLSYQGGNIKKLFNSSGNLYREMELSEKLKSMSLEHALKLLETHGMLVKRPFLLSNDFGLVGFNEAEWSKKFS